MKQVIQQVKKNLAVLTVLLMGMVIYGCSKNEGKYEFQSSKEAIKCCHSKLYELTAKKEASIEDLSIIINDFFELKDSCYSIFLKDTTFDYSGELAVEFVGVSDSIQKAIINLAMSKPRSMTDVVDLKVGTANERKRLMATKNYIEVEKYFDSLDELPLLPDTRTTIAEYLKLLEKNIPVDEQAITMFLAREDQCFRSLLKYFPNIPQDIVQTITNNTVEVFDNLEDSLLTHNHLSGMDDKMMIYMTMRLNRRIIQNATSCYQQVKNGTKLSQYASGNYRWMLMQPFMAIDQTSMAAITDGQIKSMKEIAKELPVLLAELDGNERRKISKEESDKLSAILSEFFLNTYLKMIL